jgi:O-antigen polymerase
LFSYRINADLKFEIEDYFRILLVLLSSICFCLLSTTDPFIYHWDYRSENFIPYLSVGVVSLVGLVFKRAYCWNSITPKKIDAFVWLTFLILFVSALSSGHVNVSQCIAITFGLAYFFLLRDILISRVEMMMFFAPIILQLLFELGSALYKSHISFLDWGKTFNGALGNSGIYCGYISSFSFVLLMCLDEIRINIIRKLFKIFLICLIFMIVWKCQSRAAFLALSICLFLYAVNIQRLRARWFEWFIFKKVAITALAFCLTFAIGTGLYLAKIDSASGRILIWKISLLNYLDSPFFGIGFGNFPACFLKWQANYFANRYNSDPQEVKIADVSYDMFNEPLQLLVEAGPIAVLSFGVIFYLLFKSAFFSFCSRGSGLYLTLALLCICIFSLFSYPFHSTKIFFFFIILVSVATNLGSSSFQPTLVRFRAANTMMLLVLIFCALIYTVRYMNHVSKWEMAQKIDNPSNLQHAFHVLYPMLKMNGQFLNSYGKILFRQEKYLEAIAVLNQAKDYLIYEDTFKFTALAYEEMGDYKSSEKEFYFLINMLPNRFYPRLLLTRLYLRQGDIFAASILAKETLAMPVKIPSSEVDFVKHEMQVLLQGSDAANNYE